MTTFRFMSLDYHSAVYFGVMKNDITDGSLVAVDASQIRYEPFKAICRRFVLLNLPKL
jgi:hypothetical protein